MRKGLWTKNPVDDPKFKFKRPESLPKPFDQLESGRIMALALPDRDTLLRALLYYTGLRVSPICQLKMGDVSFAPLVVGGSSLPGSIRTLSKGGKRQLVPMAPELAPLLSAWMQTHQGQSYDPLFAGRTGGCLRRSTVERMTQAWGKRAQVSNCIPHRFRHTYATDLRRQGVELDVIQRLLGHSNIATTQVYARVADEELVAAVLGRSHTAPPYVAEVTPTSN
jgi:integrase/recombinase XerD